jgi:hypothetical protein
MDKKKELPRYLILREAYRNLSQFATLAKESIPGPSIGTFAGLDKPINGQYSGLKDVIEYKGITLSYFDLLFALKKTNLPPRKREAFYYNVILDMKQKDVAKIMNISPVSVGQYVLSAVKLIEEVYFSEERNAD